MLWLVDGMGGKKGVAGGRGDGGAGVSLQLMLVLSQQQSPNCCSCTWNVQKFGFPNLAQKDFFFYLFLVVIITKYAVQCSAVQCSLMQCVAVRCGLV